MVSTSCGRGRKCTACHTHRYPESEPVVVALVHVHQPDGLGCCQVIFETYAVLLGEPCEACIARNLVAAGLEVTHLEFVDSAAQLIPSQILIGFRVMAIRRTPIALRRFSPPSPCDGGLRVLREKLVQHQRAKALPVLSSKM